MIQLKDYMPAVFFSFLQFFFPSKCSHMCVYMSANHLMDKAEKADGNAFEITQKTNMEWKKETRFQFSHDDGFDIHLFSWYRTCRNNTLRFFFVYNRKILYFHSFFFSVYSTSLFFRISISYVKFLLFEANNACKGNKNRISSTNTCCMESKI